MHRITAYTIIFFMACQASGLPPSYPFFYGFEGVKPRYDETGLYNNDLALKVFSDINEPVEIEDVEAEVEGIKCRGEYVIHPYRFFKDDGDNSLGYKEQALIVVSGCSNSVLFDEPYTAEVKITYSKYGGMAERNVTGRVNGLKKAHSFSLLDSFLGQAVPDSKKDAAIWISLIVLGWYLPLAVGYRILKKIPAVYSWRAYVFLSLTHLIRITIAAIAATTDYTMPRHTKQIVNLLYYPLSHLIPWIDSNPIMNLLSIPLDSLAYYLLAIIPVLAWRRIRGSR